MTSLKRREMEDQQPAVTSMQEPAQKRQKPNKQYYIGPTDYLYTDLEVVWGRLEDFPWWPGQVHYITHTHTHTTHNTHNR